MSTEIRTLIEISTVTKPSRSCRKGDSLIKEDRGSGSIIRSTAKEFLIGTREPQKNSTEQVPVTRLSHGTSFAAGRSRGDKTSPKAESEIAGALAIAEVWEIAVALATAEGQVIGAARVNSAAREIAAVLSKASIAEVAQRVAPASVAAPAGEASAAAVLLEAAAEVVVEEGVAEAAGKEVTSDECQVASEISLDTRPSTLISFDGGSNVHSVPS